MAPRLTIVLTPPRCGSTWLYNAARLVFQSAGLTVKPAHVSTAVEDTKRVIAAAGVEQDPRTVYVCKTHSMLSAAGEGVRAATILRDPRDMLASFQRFPNAADRDAPADAIVAGMIQLYDHIATRWGDAAFWARYDDLVERPAAVAAGYRAAAGLPPAPARDTEIAAGLAPENVKTIIARAEALSATPADEAAWGMDRRTGFQTGHIQDRATGKWRHALAPDDIARIHGRFGPWLEAHGFALT